MLSALFSTLAEKLLIAEHFKSQVSYFSPFHIHFVGMSTFEKITIRCFVIGMVFMDGLKSNAMYMCRYTEVCKQLL